MPWHPRFWGYTQQPCGSKGVVLQTQGRGYRWNRLLGSIASSHLRPRPPLLFWRPDGFAHEVLEVDASWQRVWLESQGPGSWQASPPQHTNTFSLDYSDRCLSLLSSLAVWNISGSQLPVMQLQVFLACAICLKVSVAQSCLTLCDSMEQPGSSVPGIPQAGTLEWVAMSFSRGSSQPRDQTWVSCIAGRIFTIWACREAQNLFEAAAFYRLLLQWNHQLCLQFHLSVSENKMQASIQAWPYKKKTLYSSEYRGLNRGHRLHSKASAKKLNGSSDVTEMNWYAISQGWGWGVLPGQGRRSWCSKNLRVEFSNKSPSLREKCEITETAPRPDGEGGWHPR